ncbi:hypothetical protein BGX28_002603, partial [Mortierella sp. GBA30]
MTRKGYPVHSKYEDRKKQKKGRSAQGQWTQEWKQLKAQFITKAEAITYVKEKAKEANTQKKKEETVIKKLRDAVKDSRAVQAQARLLVDKKMNPPPA